MCFVQARLCVGVSCDVVNRLTEGKCFVYKVVRGFVWSMNDNFKSHIRWPNGEDLLEIMGSFHNIVLSIWYMLP